MNQAKFNVWRFYLVAGLLLLGICGNIFLDIPSASINRHPLSDFPKVFGNWRCVSSSKLSSDVSDVLKVDDYFMRTYENGKGDVVGFYVGYFKRQEEGKQVHSPRQCLPGAGWKRIEHRELALPLTADSTKKLPNTSVNVDLMAKGSARELYVWWYQGRGRIYSNEYRNKVYLMLDAITKRRTDGALVRLNLPVRGSVNDTLAMADCFIRAVLPQLPKFIPG